MTTAWRLKRSCLAVAALVAGCNGALPAQCEDGRCGTQVSTRATVQYNVTRRIDVLLVVDDTPAIAPHLDAVAAGLPEMARALTGSPSPLSLHVGVIRAGGCNASTRGAACGVASPEQFLRSEWCQRVSNVSGAFVDAFACLADFGTEDCGPAQPLTAAVNALSAAPRAGWEGFLRPEAYLVIVVVSGADDESGPAGLPTPVLELAGRLKAIKGDPSQVAVSVIGPGDCAAGDVHAPRLDEFANQFGANGLYIGLCSGQLPAALQRLGEQINIGLQPPCLKNVRDTDTTTPGLQPDCTVVRRTLGADGAVASTAIPSCDVSQPPCWLLTSGLCPGGAAGRVLDIADDLDWCIEVLTNVTVECLSCADPNDPACATAQ